MLKSKLLWKTIVILNRQIGSSSIITTTYLPQLPQIHNISSDLSQQENYLRNHEEISVICSGDQQKSVASTNNEASTANLSVFHDGSESEDKSNDRTRVKKKYIMASTDIPPAPPYDYGNKYNDASLIRGERIYLRYRRKLYLFLAESHFSSTKKSVFNLY